MPINAPFGKAGGKTIVFVCPEPLDKADPVLSRIADARENSEVVALLHAVGARPDGEPTLRVFGEPPRGPCSIDGHRELERFRTGEPSFARALRPRLFGPDVIVLHRATPGRIRALASVIGGSPGAQPRIELLLDADVFAGGPIQQQMFAKALGDFGPGLNLRVFAHLPEVSAEARALFGGLLHDTAPEELAE